MNPDELIDVLQRDLRSPETYHQIVRALHAAGRDDEALDWGRRGLAAFTGRFSQAGPLRETLAALLRDRDQVPAAVALFWDGFANELSFGAYQRLMTEADLDGSRAVRREQAIELLRARTAADVSPKSPPPTNPRWIDTLASTPASTLVEVMLAMGDGDGAWEFATEYGCSLHRPDCRDPLEPQTELQPDGSLRPTPLVIRCIDKYVRYVHAKQDDQPSRRRGADRRQSWGPVLHVGCRPAPAPCGEPPSLESRSAADR